AAAEIAALSNGLTALGIESGDRVALIAENRPEWLIADVAIMSAGAITVPAYTTNTVDDHLHVLNDSGAKALIVSTPALAERALAAAAQVPETHYAIAIEPPAGAPVQGVRTLSWDEAKASGEDTAEDMRARIEKIERTDTSCIIYTSGTSGKPKGVMLSHGAILCNCMGAYELVRDLPDFKIDDEVFLSFLPLSHSYEHTAGQFLPISIGAQIYYAEGIDKLTANLAETQPTVMTAVPRLYEAMHTRIRRGVERAGGLRRFLFEKTVELGTREYEQPGSLGPLDRVLNGLLDKLVRAKVSERFGGRLKAFVSGGAPLNYDIGVFFTALGVRILQGYGQTEAAPVVSCNTADLNKMHTVGPPLKGVEVRIAEDGEILIRGELVMQGYWNNPEATAETVKDGWLHTGDIGVLDGDGFIQITDRKKDIIVNSGGDNLSPARVEGMLTAEPELSQAMVYGDKRPHLVALLVPDPDFAADWSKQNGGDRDLAVLAKDAAFTKALQNVVDRVNADLSVIERVRRIIVAPEAFTIENEMMTPTLKLRRHVIKEKYGADLDKLYAH
ncbi:MAG: AMP-dependent synthetase/ligase, partial [Alphaproteobacteria bacterium]|nr:AMP-dependent synthetase/ligase [Alphaproteobacteria bacterium]